jgi:hypothetical protein
MCKWDGLKYDFDAKTIDWYDDDAVCALIAHELAHGFHCAKDLAAIKAKELATLTTDRSYEETEAMGVATAERWGFRQDGWQPREPTKQTYVVDYFLRAQTEIVRLKRVLEKLPNKLTIEAMLQEKRSRKEDLARMGSADVGITRGGKRSRRGVEGGDRNSTNS